MTEHVSSGAILCNGARSTLSIIHGIAVTDASIECSMKHTLMSGCAVMISRTGAVYVVSGISKLRDWVEAL